MRRLLIIASLACAPAIAAAGVHALVIEGLAGEPVYAGSFCLSGHGAYEAQKVGSERLIEALTGEFQAVEERQWLGS